MQDMRIDECEYLAKLLKRRHDELLHELHHSVTREYKEDLRREVDLTERLQSKLLPVPVGVGA
jgi:hypothetical protein